MAKKEIWFRGPDGREHVCNEGSVAHGLMAKDHSFLRIPGPGETPSEPDETKEESLEKLNVKQLREKATLLDVPVTAEMKKAEIVEAINEKLGNGQDEGSES